MSLPSPKPRLALRVRDATESDMRDAQLIYGHYVATSLATFEETAPSFGEMLARRRACLDLALPYLVAEAEGAIVGFAYVGAYRARPAYRFTVEDSVYVAQSLGGRGVGTALLTEAIQRCERGPWRQMIAVVGDSANAGSIALHRKLGFELVGTLRAVGYKFGRFGPHADPAASARPRGAAARLKMRMIVAEAVDPGAYTPLREWR